MKISKAKNKQSQKKKPNQTNKQSVERVLRGLEIVRIKTSTCTCYY